MSAVGRCVAALALACVAACASSATAPSSEHVASVDFEGVRVVYSERGTGPEALVFVHGWACDRTFWRAQMNAVGNRHAIAIDLPGHGASQLPQARLTMDLFARSIAAVLDAAHVERAILVGHSNGTPVARQFYRRYPQRTAALVVVDGALEPFFDDPAELEPLLAPLRGPQYREAAAHFVDAMLPSRVSAANREHIRSHMLATPQRTMVEAMEAVLDPALWRDDPIEVPVLAVYAKSPAWTADYESDVRRLCSRVEYHVLDGVSHFLMMDDPARFDALLASFVERNGLAVAR